MSSQNQINQTHQKNQGSDNIPKLRFPEFSANWEEVLLSDIATFTKGKNISKNDIVEDGETECIRYGELYTEYNEVINTIVSKTNLPIENLVFSEANDIIIPSSGETQLDIATASCVMKGGVALGGDLNIIKTKKDGVFISYYLNNKKKKDIAALAQGNSVVHLYNHQLKGLFLNLPTLPEQQKIASFLTVVDDKIEQLTKKLSLLEQYKKGVMQQLFCLNYDKHDLLEEHDVEKRNQEKKSEKSSKSKKSRFRQLRFKKEDGTNYPDWEERKISEIFKVTRGQVLAATKVKNSSENDFKYPVYSSQTLNDGLMGYFNEYLFENAITWTTDGANAGVTKYRKGKFYCTNVCGVLLSGEGYANQMIAELLNTITKRHVSYVGNPKLMNNVMSGIKITIPKSIEEQTQIAKFLSAIDDKIALVNTQLENTVAFKKGLLQQMFV